MELNNSCLGFSLERGLQVLLKEAHSIAQESRFGIDIRSFLGGCAGDPTPLPPPPVENLLLCLTGFCVTIRKKIFAIFYS